MTVHPDTTTDDLKTKNLPANHVVPDYNPFYAVMQAIIRVVSTVYFRLQTFGAENTPPTGPVVLVCNHASHIDPTTIACNLPRQTYFLAKEDLFVGLLGKFLRKVNSHPINRSGVDKAALKLCVDIVRQGHMLMVFPEGQRTEDGSLQEGKPGSAMIALMANAQILPAYIDGSLDVMPKGAKFPRPRKVRVFVGKSFPSSEGIDTSLPKREQYAALTTKIMTRLAELQQQARTFKSNLR